MVLCPTDRLDLATVERTSHSGRAKALPRPSGRRSLQVLRKRLRVSYCASCRSPTRTAHRRDGSVDLETGVVATTIGPEVIAQALFRDRLVGVVRIGHPLSTGKVTSSRFVSHGHVLIQRRGLEMAALDEALSAIGLERNIATIVGGFATALALARSSDLVATVPERHTAGLRAGMFSFPLPLAMPEFTVSLLWQPALDADPAHQLAKGLCPQGVWRLSVAHHIGIE